ncbi:MAG TPA: DUF4383 domain-containing protein [Phycisphaeraceae bacterium]
MADVVRNTAEPTNPAYVGPAKWVCWILGAVFILIAILGFFGNDMVFGVFMVNAAHNWIHLISGIVLLAMGFATEVAARSTCWTFAVIYGIITILGFLGVPWLVDLLELNMADNWLHLLLTIVFVGGALASQYQVRHRERIAPTPTGRGGI